MRLWHTSRESGRPFPRFTDDDVLDFILTEAIRIRVGEDTKEQQDAKEREDFRGSHKGLTKEALFKQAEEMNRGR